MTDFSEVDDKEKAEFAFHFGLMNLSLVMAVIGLLSMVDSSPVTAVVVMVFCGAAFLDLIYFLWRFGNVIIHSSGWLIYGYKVLLPVAAIINGFSSLYLFKTVFPFLL